MRWGEGRRANGRGAGMECIDWTAYDGMARPTVNNARLSSAGSMDVQPVWSVGRSVGRWSISVCGRRAPAYIARPPGRRLSMSAQQAPY